MGPSPRPWRSAGTSGPIVCSRTSSSLLHPFELSAKTLLAGLLGFVFILVADSVALALALHESVVDAVYSATKTIVTVGPSTRIDNGPAWLKLYSAVMMLAALGFTGVFIAGLIDRCSTAA